MTWPSDPFALLPEASTEFAPGAQRRCTLLPGVDVDLYWLPCRKDRPGVPTDARPAFRPSPAERILATEALWRNDDVVLTPNRFPFDAAQCVLWSTGPHRDPTLPLLEAAFELADRTGGTALGNSTGAAASIPRAHIHLIGARNDALRKVPRAPVLATELPPLGTDRIECFRLAAPYPIAVVGIDGSAADRAVATHSLLQQRTTPAFNLASSGGLTWVWPRSATEIPSPWFPHALGAAELWGRWCYADREAYDSATPGDLLEALRTGGHVGPLA